MPNNAVTLSGALKERLLFVPSYQRPYAWEFKQLEDLWQDVDLMGDQARHYTGTLVFKEYADREYATDVGDTLVHCDVVDGQQRLTTCLLLIDRLRRAFHGRQELEGAEPRADRLASNYGPVSIDGARRARLQLGEELNHHWLNVILGNGIPDKPRLTGGEKRLSEAAAYFDTKISDIQAGLPPHEALGELQRLQARITSGLRFLVYEVEPQSHAGEVFETLNSRGRDLTALELIKNYLLYMADSLGPKMAGPLVGEINRTWSRVYDSLAGTGANEDLFLRAHWLATINADARSWRGSTSVKQLFSREKYVPGSSRLGAQEDPSLVNDLQLAEMLTRGIRSYLDSLRACALFTDEFLSPSAAFESFGDAAHQARVASGRLRRSGVTAVFRPLIFAVRLAAPRDGRAYAMVVDACERYSARVFTIGQRRSNAGQARLYRIASNLHKGVITPQDAVSEIDALTWNYADDDGVRAGLSPQVNWYWRPGHKYFLYEYEVDNAKRDTDVADFETYYAGSRSPRTTEHILPQKPRFDREQWASFSEQEHQAFVNGIGNLVLTDDNSSYSNKPFCEKKGSPSSTQACYANSRLVQEREIALLDDWTPTELETRRSRLVEWALERWHISPPRQAVADEEGGEDMDLDTDEQEDAAIDQGAHQGNPVGDRS